MTRPLLLIVVTLLGCGGKGTLTPDSGHNPPTDGDVTTDVIAGAGGGAAGSEGLAGSNGAAGSTGDVDAGPAGRPGDGGIEAGAVPLSLADYLVEGTKVTCELYARCGYYPDAATCEAATTPGGPAGLTLVADVAAGRVIYDGVRGRACLDVYRTTAGCSISHWLEVAAQPDPCSGVFTGMQPAGAVCAALDECVAGTDCLLSGPCTMACCSGTCVARALRGASCDAAYCADGSYCRPQTGRCTAKSTIEGSVCDAGDGCAAPLFCALDAVGNGTCEKTLPATGAACQPTVGCDDYRDVCADSFVCARRIGLGRACPSASTDPQGGCVNHGYCQGGICLGYGLQGDACRSDPTTGATDCLGFECPEATMKCTPATPISCR